MKKRFLIPACVLLAAAVGFVLYALGHPELSFPWGARVSHILYGLYGDGVVLMFVLAFWKKTDRAYLPVVILELGAVFFLIQSVLTVFPECKSNWYLPLALALNGIALILNAVLQKQAEKQEKKNRDPEPETEVERTGAKPI